MVLHSHGYRSLANESVANHQQILKIELIFPIKQFLLEFLQNIKHLSHDLPWRNMSLTTFPLWICWWPIPITEQNVDSDFAESSTSVEEILSWQITWQDCYFARILRLLAKPQLQIKWYLLSFHWSSCSCLLGKRSTAKKSVRSVVWPHWWCTV